jgi:hypothetical protein
MVSARNYARGDNLKSERTRDFNSRDLAANLFHGQVARESSHP